MFWSHEMMEPLCFSKQNILQIQFPSIDFDTIANINDLLGE